jgi:hypothetical protein
MELVVSWRGFTTYNSRNDDLMIETFLEEFRKFIGSVLLEFTRIYSCSDFVWIG